MRDRDNALFYVAVKIFMRDGDKLLILKDAYGDWDLPGGRIRNSEFELPLKDVIKREMNEELGAIKYKLSEPKVYMRHSRHEQSMKGKPLVRIFAIGFEAHYLGGKIKLSDEHTEKMWVEVKSFKPEKYFKGGWLKGIQEYLEKTK